MCIIVDSMVYMPEGNPITGRGLADGTRSIAQIIREYDAARHVNYINMQ